MGGRGGGTAGGTEGHTRASHTKLAVAFGCTFCKGLLQMRLTNVHVRFVVIGIAAATLLGFVVSASIALAQPKPTFRKLQFGIPISQQIPECPAAETCWSHKSADDDFVQFKDGFPISDMHRIEEDGNLVGLAIMFGAGTAPEVANILTGRYGKPASSVTRQVLTGAGVQLPQKHLMWKPKGLVIELVWPSFRIDDAHLAVYSKARWEWESKYRADESKSAIDALR
jgi:hypothetical protein